MKLLSVLIVVSAILLLPGITAYDEYVSSPAKVPNFTGFYIVDSIIPGNTETLNFTVTNRYDENMENVNLTIEIYNKLTYEEYENITHVTNAPIIKESGNLQYSITVNEIKNNSELNVYLNISTSAETEEGVYSIRMMLKFEYNNTNYIMKSKGYFTNKEWDTAYETSWKNTSYQPNVSVLCNELNVDGIIPDTSFTVKNPISLWPFIIILGVLVILGILIINYSMNEKKTTKIDKVLYQTKGKYKELEKFVKHELKNVREKQETDEIRKPKR